MPAAGASPHLQDKFGKTLVLCLPLLSHLPLNLVFQWQLAALSYWPGILLCFSVFVFITAFTFTVMSSSRLSGSLLFVPLGRAQEIAFLQEAGTSLHCGLWGHLRHYCCLFVISLSSIRGHSSKLRTFSLPSCCLIGWSAQSRH